MAYKGNLLIDSGIKHTNAIIAAAPHCNDAVFHRLDAGNRYSLKILSAQCCCPSPCALLSIIHNISHLLACFTVRCMKIYPQPCLPLVTCCPVMTGLSRQLDLRDHEAKYFLCHSTTLASHGTCTSQSHDRQAGSWPYIHPLLMQYGSKGSDTVHCLCKANVKCPFIFQCRSRVDEVGLCSATIKKGTCVEGGIVVLASLWPWSMFVMWNGKHQLSNFCQWKYDIATVNMIHRPSTTLS